jgi:predicted RNase H-like nuclease
VSAGGAGARALVGVDGCRGGWVAVSQQGGGEPAAEVFARFESLLGRFPAEAVVAVDMPIGLPERGARGGRAAESAARGALPSRRSSIFSTPSRAAVYAEPGQFKFQAERIAAFRRALVIARATSDPPRGFSMQAFCIMPKVREIDRALRSTPALRNRVFESHPELAFWRLNDESPLTWPKKSRGKINPAGMEERRQVLSRHGLSRSFLDSRAPGGASTDDFIDACAMLLVAGRKAAGLARPFPDAPGEDAHGIPIAIWS